MAKLFDVILLVGGAAALWYAYKKGYLEDILGSLGGGGGTPEPEPVPASETPAEEVKEDAKAKADTAKEDAKKKADEAKSKAKKSTKKSKLALTLAYAGSHYDGEVLDTAYFVTTPSSFIPRKHENTIAMGVAIA